MEITLFGPRGQRGDRFIATKKVDFYGRIAVRPSKDELEASKETPPQDDDLAAVRRRLIEQIRISDEVAERSKKLLKQVDRVLRKRLKP